MDPNANLEQQLTLCLRINLLFQKAALLYPGHVEHDQALLDIKETGQTPAKPSPLHAF